MENDFTNLGWANGWKEDPEIIEKCNKLGHKVGVEKHEREISIFTHEVTCAVCRYRYKYDSS